MTSGRFRLGFVFLGMVLVLLPAGAHAQTGAASITGLVTDQSGAARPGSR